MHIIKMVINKINNENDFNKIINLIYELKKDKNINYISEKSVIYWLFNKLYFQKHILFSLDLNILRIDFLKNENDYLKLNVFLNNFNKKIDNLEDIVNIRDKIILKMRKKYNETQKIKYDNILYFLQSLKKCNSDIQNEKLFNIIYEFEDYIEKNYIKKFKNHGEYHLLENFWGNSMIKFQKQKEITEFNKFFNKEYKNYLKMDKKEKKNYDKGNWTGNFGENIVNEIFLLIDEKNYGKTSITIEFDYNENDLINDFNKKLNLNINNSNEKKKLYKLCPDLTLNNYYVEVKTHSWFTGGTAREKIPGIPHKYAKLYKKKHKKNLVVLLCEAEEYGNERSLIKNSEYIDKNLQKINKFNQENCGVIYLPFTDLLLSFLGNKDDENILEKSLEYFIYL